MEPSTLTQIIAGVVAVLGTGGAYNSLIKRARASEDRLRREMKESNEKCEAQNDELKRDMKEFRDNTIAANTDAFNRVCRFLDRHSSSGEHLAVRNKDDRA